MALQANDVLKIVVSLAFPETVVAQNIFWALFDADGSSTDDDDVLDDLEDYVEAIYANILASLVDEVSLDELKVYVYDSVGEDFDEVGTRTITGVGTNSGEILPHGVAGISRGSTTDPDVTGAKFWGGFAVGANSEGFLAAGTITQIVAATLDWVTTFVGSATGSGFTPGVWSPTNTAFYPFNLATQYNALWGYQRRRKPGVGI